MTLREYAARSFTNSLLLHGGLFTLAMIVILAINEGGLDVGVVVGALVGGLIFGAIMALLQTRSRSKRPS